jgi:hypothetical protein
MPYLVTIKKDVNIYNKCRWIKITNDVYIIKKLDNINSIVSDPSILKIIKITNKSITFLKDNQLNLFLNLNL